MTTNKLGYGRELDQLEAAVIRQADSMGLEYGSDEWFEFMVDRIVGPEIKTRRAIVSHDQKVASYFRHEDWLDTQVIRVMERAELTRFYRWCKTNKGESYASAARLFPYAIAGTKDAAKQSLRRAFELMCVPMDGSDWLIDGPDRLLEAEDPSSLDSGGRLVGNYREE